MKDNLRTARVHAFPHHIVLCHAALQVAVFIALAPFSMRAARNSSCFISYKDALSMSMPFNRSSFLTCWGSTLARNQPLQSLLWLVPLPWNCHGSMNWSALVSEKGRVGFWCPYNCHVLIIEEVKLATIAPWHCEERHHFVVSLDRILSWEKLPT